MKNLALSLAAFLFAITAYAQEWTKWQITYESNNEVFTAIDFYDHENGVVVGENGVIKVTDDAGQTWTDYSSTSFGDILGVDMYKSDEIYLFNQHEVYRLSGSSLSSEMIFKNDEIDIKYCEKQFKRISGDLDEPYINIGANKNQVFRSQSNGDKWYKSNIKVFNEEDDILLFFGVPVNDTVYNLVYSETGRVLADNGFGSIESQNKFFDNTKLKKINNCNSHSPWYSIKHIVGVDYNGNISLAWGSSLYDLDHSTNTELNDAVLVAEMISSKNNESFWLGWAVGDNGYLAEYYAKLEGGEYKPITSPTSKNLKAINFSSEYIEENSRKFAYGTVCIAGDGVIMMCYIDWNPSTSVDFVQKEVSSTAYPNPFTGALNISLAHLENNEPLSIKVSNLQGQVLVQENYSNVASNSFDLQLGSNLSKGVYFLEITNGSGTQVQKIVKE
ncbi:MAG: T9SS type A sorting domain-containing protein [Bacteroidia bacterium]